MRGGSDVKRLAGLALLAALALGGLVFYEPLEGFGFALIIGVLIGTYSSMFIASPVLLYLENRRIKNGGAPIGVATTDVEATPESV